MGEDVMQTLIIKTVGVACTPVVCLWVEPASVRSVIYRRQV